MKSLVIFAALWCVAVGTRIETTEHKLVKHLLKNYNPEVRPPSVDKGNVTKVSFAMTIIQVIGVSEKNEELTTSSYVIHNWADSRFSWRPEDYENITVFRMPADNIWTPRIILTNSKDGEFDVALRVNTLIKYDGTVEWLPPTLYKSSCSINVALFPFDWQNCTMIFKSATYERDEVDLISTYDDIILDPGAFQPNGEWDLVQRPARVNTRSDDPLYVDITFYFIMRRKPQFYVMNIIIPCVLMTMLSLFVFFLPSISCEKMTLSISILLGQTIFLFLIAQRMPETSISVPLIGGYLLFSMVLIIFCVIFSVIVCNLHFRTATTHEMTNWMRAIFIDWLAPKLNVVRPDQTSVWDADKTKPRRANSLSSRKAIEERATWRAPSEILFDYQAKRYGFQTRHVQNDGGFTDINSQQDGAMPSMKPMPASISVVPKALRSTVDNVKFITRHVKKDNDTDQVADDWAYVALILDRLLFWVYLLVFTVGSAAFFLKTTFEDYPKPV